jgi:hypothetical protein
MHFIVCTGIIIDIELIREQAMCLCLFLTVLGDISAALVWNSHQSVTRHINLTCTISDDCSL